MNLQQNISLADFSTFRIGGPADYFVRAKRKEEVMEAVGFSKKENIPLLVIGGGSNILFSDKGFRGLVLKVENREIEIGDTATSSLPSSPEGEPILNPPLSGEKLVVGAGAMNIEVYRVAKEKGLDFSPFYTIPGTIGGAVMGNAGVPAGEMKDIFVSVEAFDIEKNEFVILEKDFFEFSYRHTVFHEKPELRKRYILWSVTMNLLPENPTEIEKKAKDFLAMRKEKQPWGKTGGSFFKNPESGAAGYFLEKAGFKGFHHKGAHFSEKHANFMMNSETSTQTDIIELANMAKQKIKNDFDVILESEVRILDEHGKQIMI